MNVRQVNADWMKGVAIVLMIYGHVTHVGSWVAMQNSAVTFIYSFHMPLFLIVSGFFYRASISVNPDARRKLGQRIVVPYLFWGGLYLLGLIIIQWVGFATSNAPPSSALDFVWILLIHPKGAYWFLHSLIAMQLCCVVARAISVRLKTDDAVLLCIAVALMGALVTGGVLQPRVMAYFLFGMMLKKFSGNLPSNWLIGIVGAILVGATFRGAIGVFSTAQIAWVLSLLMLLSGIAEIFPQARLVTCFAWLGRNSLIFLVLHAVFIVGLKPVAKMFLLWDVTGVSYSFFVTFLTVAGCLGIARVMDRLRISRFVFGANAIYSSR